MENILYNFNLIGYEAGDTKVYPRLFLLFIRYWLEFIHIDIYLLSKKIISEQIIIE